MEEEIQALTQWFEGFCTREAAGNPVTAYEKAAIQPLVFAGLIEDLRWAIEVFGYEAVYYGIGCQVFPDAVSPCQAVRGEEA